jgi:integrase/recombinase XerD
MNFDYEQFAKEFIKQMPGNLKVISLKDFVDEYIAFVERNRADKTYEGVKLVCKHLLRYFSPIRKVDTIKLKDAEGLMESLKGNAPKGIYNYQRALRAMWNKGIQWNYLRENPFAKIKLQKRQNQKPVFVTEALFEVILPNIEAEVVRDFVITAFYTGCRLGELVKLTWQDVNIKDEVITIGRDNYQTKSRKQRIVPMHTKVKEVLMERSKKLEVSSKMGIKEVNAGVNGYVFCKSNGCGYTADYFSRRFKRACRKAGIDERIHFHCLRHGAATRMIINGAPVPAVQRILGHANIQTTMIYTHPDLESLRDAVNRL